MRFYLLGLSHKTADVEVREKVAVGATELPGALCRLRGVDGVFGSVVLSTCNRTEFYLACDDPLDARAVVEGYLEEAKGVDAEALAPHLYELGGEDVAEHLFRVACSLDSMVLGEQQIAGQVRRAHKAAVDAGTLCLPLSRMFEAALACAKRVRRETGVSDGHVSVATVAVDVARQVFGSLEGKTVLVVGSGEMSELAARYLQEQGVGAFIVARRTHAHACHLAAGLGGVPRRFEDLPELLKDADIVVSSTAAPHPIIRPELLEGISRRMLVLDIALPRDVVPACADNPLVDLYDLDDLSRLAQANRQKRLHAAERAQELLLEEKGRFVEWMDAHAATPAVKELRCWADDVREAEVEHLLRVIDADLSPEDVAAVNACANAIVNKLIHTPTVRMKQCGRKADVFACVEASRYLFGFTEVPPTYAMGAKVAAAEDGDGLFEKGAVCHG